MRRWQYGMNTLRRHVVDVPVLQSLKEIFEVVRSAPPHERMLTEFVAVSFFNGRAFTPTDIHVVDRT